VRSVASERLLLRPWDAGDADFLLDLESRWEVVRFLGPDPQTLSTRAEALASITHRRAVDHPIHGIWVITTAAEGRPVGNLVLDLAHRSAGEPSGGPEDVEIGWHLHPDDWGHGYATEAAGAVLGDAFGRGLARVIALTNLDNSASQAVCRRLGMSHLGRTTRYYDTTKELFEKAPG
jgi:RimJ/RimL family protein N-acetyltransferase